MEKCGSTGDDNETAKRRLINATRRWTEVDYKMSGFTKEYEWHDSTALACAVRCSHGDVVEYLLRRGADPTLRGCPDDNVHYDAFGAVPRYASEDTSTIRSLMTSQPGQNSLFYAKAALQRRLDKDRIIKMLEIVKPFWKPAAYSHSRYTETRHASGFPNLPRDSIAMNRKLDEVPGRIQQDENSLKFQRMLKVTKEVEQQVARETERKTERANAATAGQKRRRVDRGSTKNTCPVCGRHFESAELLQQHLSTSSGKAHKRYRKSL